MTLEDLGIRIVSWREGKGFFTPESINSEPAPIVATNGDLMLGKLMLVVTELAEAAESVRDDDIDNFQEELADAFHRLLDICATVGIDVEGEIERKMSINETRPVLHGHLTSL